MAQLTLAELLKGREKLAGQDQASEPQRMSVEEFRKMYATDVEKAKELTTATETLSSEVKDINSTSGDSLNSNIKKLYEETKKISKGITNLSREDAKDVTGKALDKPQFKTIGERVRGKVDSFKDFFTMRGFLDKSGIVKRGTGGIFDTMLAKRDARNESVAARMQIDPQMVNLKQFGGSERKLKAYLGKQFDKAQDVTAQMRGNEAKIDRLKAAGYTEDQMGKTGLLKKRASLATEIGKYDKTLRVKGEAASSGKAYGASSPNDMSEKEEESIGRDEKVITLLGKIEENTRIDKDNIKREEAKPANKPETPDGQTPSLMSRGKGLLKKFGRFGRFLPSAGALGTAALAAAPMAAMYGATKWAESASIKDEKGELTGTGAMLDTASKAVGGEGVKARSEMSNTELVNDQTKVGWWEIGGKKKRIKKIEDDLERGVTYTAEEAAVIKKNLDFEIPKESIKLAAIPEMVSKTVSGSGVSQQLATSVTASPSKEASAVYDSSGANAGAATQSTATPPVVIAPQTSNVVNNHTSTVHKIPSRNNDITLRDYFKSRYA